MTSPAGQAEGTVAEALAGPVVRGLVLEGPPPTTNELAELFAAVRAELEALRRGHEGLLTGFNPRSRAGGRGSAVAIVAGGLERLAGRCAGADARMNRLAAGGTPRVDWCHGWLRGVAGSGGDDGEGRAT